MDKTKLLRFLVVGLVLLNTACIIFLFAGRHHGPPPPPHGGPKQIIIDRLHFDARQQAEYSRMVDVHRQEMFALNEESKEMHDKLYSLLKSPITDETEMNKLLQAISDNQLKLERLNFAHFREIGALCRDDQKAAFNKLVGELGELFHSGPPPGRP